MQLRKTAAFFFSLLTTLMVSAAAFAEEAAGGGSGGKDLGLKFLAAALSIGVAALGGALGQGKAGSAALEGIARNPNASGKIFNTMILVLALIESLVIYALVISLLLLFVL